MKDAKLDEMKVYCRDYKDWSDVGFSFTKNGEEFVIDKESAFKVAWQPVEIGQETMVSFDVVEDEKNAVEFFANKLEEKETQIKSEYETKIDEAKAEVKAEYDAQIEKLNSELEELKSYKYEIEKATKTDYVNAVENLTDEEREELVAKVDDYTIESLTDEVAKIVGKKSIKFSTNSTKVVDNINTNFDYNKKPQRAYYHLMDKK
jgi:phage host-nuclease inhibitor protein Gam